MSPQMPLKKVLVEQYGDYIDHVDPLKKLFLDYARHQKELGIADFDSLLVLMRDLLRHEQVGPMIRRRFELEARATASLRSPHTVALFDFGQTRDRAFYYVMELLDGVDLQTLVDRYGPLNESRVVHILVDICESLEEAHRPGQAPAPRQ